MDIVRLHKDGELDSLFGTAGVLTLNTDTIIPFVKKVLIDEEGNYYLAGYRLDSLKNEIDFALVKLSNSFILDESFGNGGAIIMDVIQTDDVVNDAALLPNGKVLLADYASTIYYEAKLTLAQYFGRDTVVTTDTTTIPPHDSLILNENGLTILPNPVGDDFQICYPLQGKSIVSIDLFNSVGALLYSFLSQGVRDEGRHCEQFNWPEGIVEKGVYFVRLSGVNFAYSGQILKP